MIKRFFSSRHIFTSLLITIMGVVLIGSFGLVSTASAQASKTSVCQGVDIASGGDGTGAGCSSGGENLQSVLEDILNVLSLVGGVIAIIMLAIGGLRYVISGGNDQAVSGAKNAIMYALIGLAIVALAQFIVHFVLHNVKL